VAPIDADQVTTICGLPLLQLAVALVTEKVPGTAGVPPETLSAETPTTVPIVADT